MNGSKTSLPDQLRAAIRNCGESENALAKRSGVPQPTINRFVNGADAKLSVAGRLAKALGLTLRRTKSPPRGE